MNRIRPYLVGDVLLPLVVTSGVILAAALDWLQGQAPESRIPGIAGFVPFVFLALVCLGSAIQATDARRSPRWRLVSLVAALVGAALADPTYAALLAVVPLIEISRRADEPERSVSIIAGMAFISWLAITEPGLQGGSGFESILVLYIVFAIVVMFGNALRRSDRARILEARLARVDERNRLASDIHDSLGHNLLASSIQLRAAQALIDKDSKAASNSIELASRAVAEALADTRFAVDGTRADGGAFSLESSLTDLVARSTTTDVSVSLTVEGDHDQLDSLEQITLYRFAQEALANVIRHADATKAYVRSTVLEGIATVAVEDDGRGFDPATASERTGLANLRQRLALQGGSVRVSSAQGSGTTVTAVLEASS